MSEYKRGRPVEPNSIRSEAARRGVSLWQVRKDRGEVRKPKRVADDVETLQGSESDA